MSPLDSTMPAHERAILDEHAAAQARAIAEMRDTPSSNIRNGLQILMLASVDGQGSRTLSAEEFGAVYSRLKAAIDELEASTRRLRFHDIVRHLREKWKCPDCGKCTMRFNAQALMAGSLAVRRGYTPERVSLELHCACPPSADRKAGPAYELARRKR